MQHRRQRLHRPSELSRYSLRLGSLVERHMAHAALLAARQEAECEAHAAHAARRESEAAAAALREEIVARTGMQSRLAFLASHDPLTTLPNRALLNERLAAAMTEARRHGRRLALLYLDLDHFKDVNDTRGHAAGDDLLQQVAARLEAEIGVQGTLARMGGDEFALLQPDCDGPARARALGERLVAALSRSFAVGGASVFVGASVGITLFPDDADTLALLHRNADLALYCAKEGGRNRCHFFDDALNRQVRRRAAIEQALREPCLPAQLRLAFQPQVDLRSGATSGMEALLRWQHPEHGLVPPDEFIPLAERSSAILDIGSWVLREGCHQAAAWRAQGRPLVMAVNVATAQFRDADMPRLVAEMLAATGLPASLLELEVTETGVMHDMHGAAEILLALHQLGVSLAIDDFGTGYSSLSYLRRLPVDRLKIDRSFVSDVPSNEDAAAVASTIVKLAHNLRLEVVAEGVETPEQVRFVRATGCAFAQGFFYGRPSEAVDLCVPLQAPRLAECVA